MNFFYQKVHVLILPIFKVYMILLHSYYIFFGPGGKATFHFHYFENYCLSKSKYKIEIHIFWQRYVLLWKLRMAAVHRTRNSWWIIARRHANYVVRKKQSFFHVYIILLGRFSKHPKSWYYNKWSRHYNFKSRNYNSMKWLVLTLLLCFDWFTNWPFEIN